jgi:WD40 repeat protein
VDVNEVRLWDVTTRQLKTEPTPKKGFISSVAFTPDSRTVATASLRSLEVKLWDVQTGRLKATLVHAKEDRYANSIGNVAFAPDGRTLATSSNRAVEGYAG